MSQTVIISRPYLEALLATAKAFEEYTAQVAIKHCTNNASFEAYLASRAPFLHQLYVIEYALQYGLAPDIVAKPSTDTNCNSL